MSERAVELAGGSREELLAVIAAQQATIAQQQATITTQAAVIGTLQGRITELERRLGSSGGKGVPGTKPVASQRSKASGQPRKHRDQGYARVRMTPTAVVQHAAEHCPACGTRLLGGWVKRRREVIDLPITPVTVTEHQILARTCPRCQRQVLPADPLVGVVQGKQRFGVRLQSVIATLREALRVPVHSIQRLLRHLYDLRLSRGAITAASDRVAAAGHMELQAIRDRIRGSPVVHADETGWRQTGQNGYVWTFCTPTERFFLRRGRHKEVVDEVLGDAFSGVLCSDFYAAYHHYPGLKQRCWVHLLREIHDLIVTYPDDASLAGWATAVRAVYDDARTFTSPDPRALSAAQARFQERLLLLCDPFATDPTALQARLCRRIQRHSDELFVFVAHPDVPSDNNAAERSVRPLVTSRKISGGTRSDQGSHTKMTNASLFGTWHVRGLNPFDQCFQLLAAPQV
ncbi:MAG: IS66 family transposase [Pseudonocardiaceae bacterium]